MGPHQQAGGCGMCTKTELPENAFKTLEIDSSSLKLRIGDRVDWETTVGRNWETGQIVSANCWGYVIDIQPDRLKRYLTVTISGPLPQLRGRSREVEIIGV